MAAYAGYVPIVQTKYLLQGMFSEQKFNQLLATGVLNIDALQDVQIKGDKIAIPQAIQVDDLMTVDLNSTTAYIGTRATTVNASAPVLRKFTGMTFTESDEIRTNERWRDLFAASAGNKIAKSVIVNLHNMLIGVTGVAGLSHLQDITGVAGATGSSGKTGVTGALTLQGVRQAKRLLGDQGQHLDTLLVHPDNWADLWFDISVNYHFGGSLASQWIENQEMDAMFGIRNIIVSQDIAPDTNSNYYAWLLKSQTSEVDMGNKGPIYLAYQANPRYSEFADTRVPSTLYLPKWNIDLALGVRGMSYTGATQATTAYNAVTEVSGGSTIDPQEQDLATAGNWALATSDTRNVGVVGIKCLYGAA